MKNEKSSQTLSIENGQSAHAMQNDIFIKNNDKVILHI